VTNFVHFALDARNLFLRLRDLSHVQKYLLAHFRLARTRSRIRPGNISNVLTWWSEIRMEIRSHARALNCNAVLGYTETTSICEDVCVLSASGTAAVIGFQYTGEMGDSIGGLPIIPKHCKDILSSSLDRNEFDKERLLQKDAKNKVLLESPEHEVAPSHINSSCAICHLPYNTNNVPIRATVLKCGTCRSGKVPDILIATIETPDGAPSVGRGCFIQSFVCRYDCVKTSTRCVKLLLTFVTFSDS
jgi:hypothetical protein